MGAFPSTLFAEDLITLTDLKKLNLRLTFFSILGASRNFQSRKNEKNRLKKRPVSNQEG